MAKKSKGTIEQRETARQEAQKILAHGRKIGFFGKKAK